MTNVEARLVQCFLAVFPKLAAADIPHASSASVPNWDSVAGVTLQAVVEEEFDISVDAADIDHFDSFEGIVKYLHGANGAQKGGVSPAAGEYLFRYGQ